MTLVKKKKKRRSRTHRVSRFHRSRNYLRFCLFLVLATALTWGVGLLDNRYEVSEHDGFGEFFPAQTDRWKLIGDQALLSPEQNVFIISPDTAYHTRAELTLSLTRLRIPTEKTIRIRTVAKTLERASVNSKTDSGMTVKGFNRNGKTIYNGWVSRLTGEFDSHRDEYMLPVSNALDSIRLSFFNRGSDGSFQLENLEVEIVKVSALYKLLLLPALLTMWAIIMMLCVLHTIRRLNRTVVLFFVGSIAVLVVGVLLPSSLRELFVQPAINQLRTMGLTAANLSTVHYYKIGHFLVFLVVSLIVFHNSRRLRIRISDLFCILVVIAVATEGAQLHLFFRSTQLLDIAIDIAGITTALLIIQLTFKSRNKGIKKLDISSANEALPDSEADTPAVLAKTAGAPLSDSGKDEEINDDEQNLDKLRSRLKNEFKLRRQSGD